MAGTCIGVLKCLAGQGAYVLVSDTGGFGFRCPRGRRLGNVLPGWQRITRERNNDEVGRVSTRGGGGASAGNYPRAVSMRRSGGASG